MGATSAAKPEVNASLEKPEEILGLNPAPVPPFERTVILGVIAFAVSLSLFWITTLALGVPILLAACLAAAIQAIQGVRAFPLGRTDRKAAPSVLIDIRGVGWIGLVIAGILIVLQFLMAGTRTQFPIDFRQKLIGDYFLEAAVIANGTMGAFWAARAISGGRLVVTRRTILVLQGPFLRIKLPWSRVASIRVYSSSVGKYGDSYIQFTTNYVSRKRRSVSISRNNDLGFPWFNRAVKELGRIGAEMHGVRTFDDRRWIWQRRRTKQLLRKRRK